MKKQTITFRADSIRINALDRLARYRDCSRSYLLNEALEQFLSIRDYHREQIEKGLEEARAGELVDYETVRADWLKRLERAERPA
jgi:predicted transcriptional regulator